MDLDNPIGGGSAATSTAGMTRRQLGDRARELVASAKAIQDRGDDATPEELESAAKAFDDARSINERLAASARAMPSSADLDRLGTDLKAERNPPTLPIGRDDARLPIVAEKSLTQSIVEAPELRGWVKDMPNQRVIFEVPGYALAGKATLLTTGLTSYERPPGVVTLGTQRPLISDLLSQARTTAKTIRYWRENTFTNAATAVAENAQKPEATFDVVEADSPIEKVAVLGKMTQELMEDYPAIADYVVERLRFMVEEREDRLLYSGNGTTPNIRGIIATSGIQTEAVGAAPDTALDAILRAITKVRAVGFFEPDAIVMHPTDYGKIRAAKASDGHYYGGGPFYGPMGGGISANVGPWGLTPIITTAATAGTALVGAFKVGATVWRRKGITIDIANMNKDDFEFNRVTVRVEARMGLTVWRPLAFATVTGIV